MSALRELQTRFLDGLFLNDPAILTAVAGENRFQVYRNNAFLILADTLKNIFPAVCALVDEKFFRYAANEFIKTNPPASGDLSGYGESFPAFLGSFEPLLAHPYMADVARLEWLRHCLYTAPESSPLNPAKLANLDDSAAETLALKLRPCVGLLRSDWPVDRIWNATKGAALPDINTGPMWILVVRRGEELEHRPLTERQFTFLSACAQGKTLPAALSEADFDQPQEELFYLLSLEIFGD